MLRATVIWSPNWISCKVVPGLWTLLVVFYSQHGLTYATLGYLHYNRSLLPDADVCDGCYQQISWKVGFHYIYLFLSGVFSLHLKLPLRTHYRLVSVTRIQGCLILCSESVWFKTYVLIFCSPVTLRHYQSMFSYRTRIRRKTLIMCSWSKFTSSAMPSTRASWSPSCLLYCSPVTLRHYHIQSSRQTTVSASNALCATLSIVLPGLMS